MAISVATEFTSPLFTYTAEDTDANATLELVDGTSGTFYTVWVDNTANAGTQVYVKFWNATATANVTLGTTAPQYVFPVAGGKIKQFCFPDGMAYDGIVMACLTAAGTGGSSGPSSDVIVRVGHTT